MAHNSKFTFEISLSVLNHLGRNLYRSFITVLGEAISNAWDADAQEVRLYIDRDTDSFVIADTGDGMNADDFQNKFLKIGYSKRKGGATHSNSGRPYIGRKGIGKLALLSCAETISVISKKRDAEYVGGVIDNSGLDEAIEHDLTPDQYELGSLDKSLFKNYVEGHAQGTILHFYNITDGIRNRVEYLKRTIALYFRFALLDKSFSVYVDGELITLDHISDLASKTEFAWNINELSDPYLNDKLDQLKEPIKALSIDYSIKGFVASVKKPRDLKVLTTDERVGVDLFVNGRLRERDILKHIPTARIAENYLYGQIHFDELDDEVDRFATAREGIVSDDPKFNELMEKLKGHVVNQILVDWDEWRRKHGKDGDSENESIPRKQRKSEELYNAVSEEYELPKGAANKNKVDGWTVDLREDAAFNFSSYAECFISENLIRYYIADHSVKLTTEAERDIHKWKEREQNNKTSGNINIEIRQGSEDASYLDMHGLATLVEEKRGVENCLASDAKQYRPIRDALMHTARLTQEAKTKLTSVYDNIKARVINLLSGKSS